MGETLPRENFHNNGLSRYFRVSAPRALVFVRALVPRAMMRWREIAETESLGGGKLLANCVRGRMMRAGRRDVGLQVCAIHACGLDLNFVVASWGSIYLLVDVMWRFCQYKAERKKFHLGCDRMLEKCVHRTSRYIISIKQC